jgi:hypothetical protein
LPSPSPSPLSPSPLSPSPLLPSPSPPLLPAPQDRVLSRAPLVLGGPPRADSSTVIAVQRTTAKPAAPTLRDLKIPAERLLGLPGVKAMIRDAGRRARRRSPRSVAFVLMAAKVLAGGVAQSAEELAARSGSRGQIAVRRAAHALDALVAAGFAQIREGRHVANEAALLRAVEVR